MSVVYDVSKGVVIILDEPIEQPEVFFMPRLTARQLRLGLINYLEQVEYIISNSDDRALQIEWEYATEFERNHPAIVSIGEAIGLTPEQIDTMWINASNT